MADFPSIAGYASRSYFPSMFQNYWGDIMFYSLIGVLISVGFTVLGYMIGSIFMRADFISWAKNEFGNAFYSIAIPGVILLLFLMADSVAHAYALSMPNGAAICNPVDIHGNPAGYIISNGNRELIFELYKGSFTSLGGGPMDDDSVLVEINKRKEFEEFAISEEPPPCHIAIANYFLDSTFILMSRVMDSLLEININLASYSSISIINREETRGTMAMAVTPFVGYSLLVETINTIYDYMMKSMAIIKIQQMFLADVHQLFFPTLLIIGIITRTVFFTRRLGGLLIAFSLALYFIFPLAYMVGWQAFSTNNIPMNVKLMPLQDPNAVSSPTAPNANPIYNSYTDFYKRAFDENYPGYDPALQDYFLMPDPAHPGQMIQRPYTDTLDRMKQGGILSTGEGNFNSPLYTSLIDQQVDSYTSLVSYKSLLNPTQYKVLIAAVIGLGGLTGTVASVLFMGIFFQVVAVFSTIATVKVFSPILGGDADIAGLTQLV
ncbi:hypothetical protein COS70_00360 [Candidatus Micrarchaeota archaeon CG06_land_8_20_14_3_00_50_6]|nr:MAG: hypothetical protein COS70_00360 [Candidatus Micrarchaeota archaeon CG06_land_8_20_14_3_00_50_6]